MKSTGMFRPLDQLGRIVLPKEMRTSMGINAGDPMEIFIDSAKNMVVLRKYVGVSCRLCGSIDNLTYFKDSFICCDCGSDMKSGKVIVKEKSTETIEVSKDRRRYRSGDVMLARLRELVSERPGLTQITYAELLGTSQSRVSQLLREL